MNSDQSHPEPTTGSPEEFDRNPFAAPKSQEAPTLRAPVVSVPFLVLLLTTSVIKGLAFFGTMIISTLLESVLKRPWYSTSGIAPAMLIFGTIYSGCLFVALKWIVKKRNPHWDSFDGRFIVGVTTLTVIIWFPIGMYAAFLGGWGLLLLLTPIFVPPVIGSVFLWQLTHKINRQLDPEMWQAAEIET